jgi:hypothetical protein
MLRKWIYLFRPEMLPNHGLATEEEGSIKTSVLRAERRVNVSKHDYALEPNVSFTPGMKWGCFGPTCLAPRKFWRWRLKRPLSEVIVRIAPKVGALTSHQQCGPSNAGGLCRRHYQGLPIGAVTSEAV